MKELFVTLLVVSSIVGFIVGSVDASIDDLRESNLRLIHLFFPAYLLFYYLGYVLFIGL